MAKLHCLTAPDDVLIQSTPEAVAITETSRDRMKTLEESTQKMISESGRSATNEMRIKLDLQFPSECCCGTVGAVGLINDLGVNASVTLFHSRMSSEYWLFPSLCLFEFLIILIFSERLILAYWNPLLLWLVESCLEWGEIFCEGNKMLSDASGLQ